MKTVLPLAVFAGLVVTANAATVAYYVDGSTANDLSNLATADADYTVSPLSQSGFSSTTSTSFGGNPTPAGPTAGSSAGSHWLFANSGVTTTPISSNYYFSFTVSGNGVTVAPSSLKADLVLMSSSGGGQTHFYEIFASTDGGSSFATVVGSGGSKSFDAIPVSSVSSLNFDLSSLPAASSYEFRIALADQTAQGNRPAFLQSIQFDVVPEPSTTALLGGLGALLMLRRRR